MADYKPPRKSRQGREVVGAQEMYNGYDVHSNGMSEVGFPKGYQDDLTSPVITHTDGKVKPLYVSSTDEDIVTRTETRVHNQAPKVQTDTGRPYKTGTVSNLYWWCKPNSNAIGGIHDYGLPAANTLTTTKAMPIPSKEAPPKGIPLTKPTIKVETDYFKDGTVIAARPLRPQVHVLPPVASQENVSLPTTDSQRAMPIPSKESPPKGIPLTKPTSKVETDHFKDGTVIAAQPLRPQVHMLPPVASQENVSLPTMDSQRAMPIPSKESPPKGIPLTKPTSKVETDHFKDGTVIVAQALGPQVHVLPPVVSQAKIALPTIDSTEAKRRYGGVSTFPAEAYVPAIDSNEAARKYRGQVL